MVKSLPIGKSISHGPNQILQRPLAAAHIGNITANWSLVEDQLTDTYALLMSLWGPVRATESFVPSHPVAIQIFATLQVLVTKTQLLTRLLKWAAGDEKRIEFLEIEKKIRQRAAERNKIVHGNWGVCNDYTTDIILCPRFGDKLVYSPEDLQDISDRIIGLRKTLADFHWSLHDLAVAGKLREPKVLSLEFEQMPDPGPE